MNVILFCDKLTSLAGKRHGADVTDLDFSKKFDLEPLAFWFLKKINREHSNGLKTGKLMDLKI